MAGYVVLTISIVQLVLGDAVEVRIVGIESI